MKKKGVDVKAQQGWQSTIGPICALKVLGQRSLVQLDIWRKVTRWKILQRKGCLEVKDSRSLDNHNGTEEVPQSGMPKLYHPATPKYRPVERGCQCMERCSHPKVNSKDGAVASLRIHCSTPIPGFEELLMVPVEELAKASALMCMVDSTVSVEVDANAATSSNFLSWEVDVDRWNLITGHPPQHRVFKIIEALPDNIKKLSNTRPIRFFWHLEVWHT